MLDGDAQGRRIEVGACPASKGVSRAGGIGEGDVAALDGVGSGVGGDHTATSKVVTDSVDIDGPDGGVGTVSRGALLYGDAQGR